MAADSLFRWDLMSNRLPFECSKHSIKFVIGLKSFMLSQNELNEAQLVVYSIWQKFYFHGQQIKRQKKITVSMILAQSFKVF